MQSKIENRIGAALTVAVVLLATVAVTSWCVAGDDHKPAKPHQLMDSPIPPGDDPTPPAVFPRDLHLTSGPYCVSVALGDQVFAHVQTFHQADVGNLDRVRASIVTAYRNTAREYEGRCVQAAASLALDAQAERVKKCRGEAALLRSRADRGVVFAGEPAPGSEPALTTEGGRPTIAGDDGPLTCTCSTLLYSPDVVGGGGRYACGGECGNCWSCR